MMMSVDFIWYFLRAPSQCSVAQRDHADQCDFEFHLE